MRCLAAGGFCKKFSDAEIQQLHLAFAIHQDIGRLEIAMHDQVLVCMINGCQDLEEEVQALANAEAVSVTILGDGTAVDVFEHDEGLASWRYTCVIEARNVRMCQSCQDLALLLETRDCKRRGQ